MSSTVGPTATNDALRDRYGRRVRPRWFWPLITVIGVAVGVAFAAWVGFQDKPVSAQLHSYDVVSDQRVDVTVEVATPDPVDVRCTVYAQAHDHSTVGEKTIDIPAAEQPERRITIPVETQRKAVNGVLRSCEVKP